MSCRTILIVGAQEGYRKKTLFQITTNGSNIGNVNTKELPINANIGNAKKIPTSGTVSYGPHISDMKQYIQTLKLVKQEFYPSLIYNGTRNKFTY